MKEPYWNSLIQMLKLIARIKPSPSATGKKNRINFTESIKMRPEVAQVIEILKKSNQTLVFLDSLICPVRSTVGYSERDSKMRQIADELKELNVIKSYSGYASLITRPWHLHISSFVLTEDFFQKNKKPSYKQITMEF